VHFVVITLGWVVLALLLAVLTGRGEFAVLALAGPVYGAAMTAILLRLRRSGQTASGLAADQLYDVQLAVSRGRVPADRATWPAAREMIATQREQLPRMGRTIPRIAGAVGILLLAAAVVLGLVGQGGAALTLALLGLVAALFAALALVTARRQARQLDALERAMDGG
jgi:Flp pilus assembly protein TadB